MKSYVFKFYELKDDVLKGIDSIKKVMDQQSELINVLNTTNSEYDFSDLKQSLIDSNEGYTKQIETLNNRLSIIQNILDKYEKGKADNASKKDRDAYLTLDETISQVFLGLGIVQEEE